MYQLYLVIASVGLTLAVVAVLAGAAKVHNHEQRIARLEQRANPASKHDWKYLERQDIGEATLVDYARIRSELKVAQDWLEYATRRARHVASGGSPDDPPTKWQNGA